MKTFIVARGAFGAATPFTERVTLERHRAPRREQVHDAMRGSPSPARPDPHLPDAGTREGEGAEGAARGRPGAAGTALVRGVARPWPRAAKATLKDST